MIYKNTAIPRTQIRGDMPRYISQKDRYSCGPVAVINYWKSLGLKATYQDVKSLQRVLETQEYPVGTYWYAMANILGTIWERVSLSKFRDSLPAIVKNDNHYWFCSNACNGGFIAINYCDRQTYHFISRSRMVSTLKIAEVLLLGETYA